MLDHALKTPAIRQDHWAGLLLAFGGAIALSFKAIVVKLAFAAGGTALSLTILRMSFALPVFAAVAIWSAARMKRRISGRELAAAALLGCIGNYLSAYLDFAGLQHVSANVERIVLFLYPTLVVLINRWWLKTPITPRQMMGFALSYGGIWLVFMSQPDRGSGSGDFVLGASLVMLSALTYASYLAFSARLIRTLGALAFTSIAMSASCLVSMASGLLAGPQAIYGQAPQVYGHALVLALVCTVAPLFMISAAIQKIGANSVAAMGTVGPLATIVLSAWLLGEQLGAIQGAGMVVVVIGVLVVGAKSVKESRQ
jgi:drug/metabolite transporter (DMT)-like permease